MRNLKKLLAVIVSICVLATFAVPAFAETKTDAQIVTDLGMVQGTTGGVTAEYLATTPTRYQAAIMFLRLKGLEDEATAFIPTDNFTDLQGLNETNKAILGYLKANPALGFEGIGNNKFDPLKPITAKEYYKVMLTALGYKENTDFTWANVLPFAASKGLYALIENTKFTVNDLATATVEALKATVKGGTMTLLAALVESGAITADKANATGFFTATPKTFEVVSATADNLKVAKFVFSKEVNGDTVKKENFTIDGTAVQDTKLLDDKKTVLVIMNAGVIDSQNKSKDIKVKDVKDTSGTAIAEVTKTVTFIDTAIPTVTGAIAKNAKTIVISASEPLDVNTSYIQVYDDIKVDDTAVSADTSFDFAKNTMTLHLTSAMTKGSHKITIAKLKDFAGYVAVDQSYNFDIPDDTTAPAIASAVVKNNTKLELTFNEDVDYLSLGSFKVNNGGEIYGTQDDNDWSKITLDGIPTLDIGATVEIKVQYKGQKDVMGNEVKDWTSYTFKVADDTTLPTVTASVESDNDIVLAFSKAMTTNVGEIKFYETDGDLRGVIVSLVGGVNSAYGEWNDDNTKLTLKALASDTVSVDPMDIKINIKDMKDATIRTNLLPETNLTVKAVDTARPTVAPYFKVEPKNAGDDKDDTITFYFSEPVKAETAKNLSNYQVETTDGIYTEAKPFSQYGDVSFSSISSNGKEVTIKAKSIAAADAESLQIKIYAIQDLAGNMMENVNNVVGLVAAEGPAMPTAKATEKNTIEVLFVGTERIGTFAPGAFVIQKATGNKAFVANIIAASIDSTDKYKVKLTIGGDIGTDPTDLELRLTNPDLIKNVYGVKIDATAGDVISIADGVKATVDIETKISKSVTLKFSEVVDVATTSGLLSEVLITKDGKRVAIDPAKVTYYNGDVAQGNIVNDPSNGFTKVVIELEANKAYKFQFYTNSLTQDADDNDVKDFAEAKAFTTLP